MDVPKRRVPPLFINSFSRYTILQEILGDLGSNVFLGSGVWPVAQKAYYIPFTLPFRYPVNRMFVCNGSGAQAGNWDVGIYTLNGTKLASAGSTAQAGASVLQYANASLILDPGSYFMTMWASLTTGTYFRYTQAFVTAYRLTGILQETGLASGLPTTLTPAALSGGELFLPLFGFTSTASGY